MFLRSVRPEQVRLAVGQRGSEVTTLGIYGADREDLLCYRPDR